MTEPTCSLPGLQDQQVQQSNVASSQPYFAAVEKMREHRSSFVESGVDGFELFEKMASLNLRYRIEDQRTNRCPSCWYDKEVRCICDRMPPRMERNLMPNVKFLLLLHHKEYLNAGNSAKVLLSLLPKEQIELYVYGREGDFDRLIEEILMDRDHTLTLWPGGDSQTIEEFLSELPSDSGWADQRNGETELKIVVLDGTYTNARNMHKTLRKRLKEKAPKNVALHPTEVSKFHRAQKTYGASIAENLKHNQNLDEKAMRISTAEACALLLRELGCQEEVQKTMLEAVLLNNVDRARNGKFLQNSS
jgi:DTW domain-containing protein YfiP